MKFRRKKKYCANEHQHTGTELKKLEENKKKINKVFDKSYIHNVRLKL